MSYNSKLPRHGSSRGYFTYKCRCDECRAWQADQARKARERRRSIPVPDHIHGTVNGYSNYDCRCDECKAAGVAAALDVKRRNRAAGSMAASHGEAS